MANPNGIIDPPIDDLLEKVDSKYALVIFASQRARQITADLQAALTLATEDPVINEALGALPGPHLRRVRAGGDRELLRQAFGDRLAGCLGVYEEVLDAAAAGGRVPLEGGFGRDLGELLDDLLSFITGSELPLKKR